MVKLNKISLELRTYVDIFEEASKLTFVMASETLTTKILPPPPVYSTSWKSNLHFNHILRMA